MTSITQLTRRQFITQTVSATAVSLAVPRLAWAAPRQMQMKLSFMTFVCPTWPIEKIVKFAKEAGYDGVEIRVDAKHKHDISSKSSAEVRRQTKKIFADAGVEIAAVATSVQFASPKPEVLKTNLESAKANLELAADLGAPVVRMFAGGGIRSLTPEAARLVAGACDEGGDLSMGSGSGPSGDCGHDSIRTATEAGEVIRQVKTSNFGALWNTSTMDDETFAVMKSRLRHFHVHDEVLAPDNDNLVGLARRMKGHGYRGYVSLEIIKNKDLPEDLLKEVAARLKRQIAEGSK